MQIQPKPTKSLRFVPQGEAERSVPLGAFPPLSHLVPLIAPLHNQLITNCIPPSGNTYLANLRNETKTLHMRPIQSYLPPLLMTILFLRSSPKPPSVANSLNTSRRKLSLILSRSTNKGKATAALRVSKIHSE